MAWGDWSETWEFATAAVATTWEAWYASRSTAAVEGESLYPTRTRVATAQDILLATLVDAVETTVSAPINPSTSQITTTSALLSWEIV